MQKPVVLKCLAVVSQRKLQWDCQRDRLSRASGAKLLWAAQGETLCGKDLGAWALPQDKIGT